MEKMRDLKSQDLSAWSFGSRIEKRLWMGLGTQVTTPYSTELCWFDCKAFLAESDFLVGVLEFTTDHGRHHAYGPDE